MSDTEEQVTPDAPELQAQPQAQPEPVAMKDVLEYFAQREAQIRQQYETQTPQQEAPDYTSQFWKDPVATVKEVAVDKQTYQATTAEIAKRLATATRLEMKIDHPAEWSKYGPQVEAIIDKLPLESRSDRVQWETALTYVKGQNMEKELDAIRKRMIAERVTATEPPKPPEIEMTSEMKDIASKFGITPDRYKQASETIEGHKDWPMTFDNRFKKPNPQTPDSRPRRP